MAEVRVIKLNESVYSKNDNQADMTRRMLNDKKVFFVNIMSSPGSGKTTMLSRLINMLKDDYRIGEMDVDIESDIDARRVAAIWSMKEPVPPAHIPFIRWSIPLVKYIILASSPPSSIATSH